MPPLFLPLAVDQALGHPGSTLVLSLSGGKDSQALLNRLVEEVGRRPDWRCQVVAFHASLGRADWEETQSHVEATCQAAGVPCRVLRRAKGDLLDRIDERIERTAAAGAKSTPPPWPSPAARYCTSDLKRNVADSLLRSVQGVVVSAEGIRAEESAKRSKQRPVSVRPAVTASALEKLEPMEALGRRRANQRLVLNWYPLFEWTEEDVYRGCGTSRAELEQRRALYRSGQQEEALQGWPLHPVYVKGLSRLACCLCFFNSTRELRLAALERPELYRWYVEREARSGFSYRDREWLADVAPELLPDQLRNAIEQRKMERGGVQRFLPLAV